MRDFKIKLKIIWLLLMDKYTKSSKDRTWYLWVFTYKDYKKHVQTKQPIKIVFSDF